MPTTDPLGRHLPTPSDAANLPAALAAYSLSSLPGRLTVTSRAQANAVVTAVTGSGASAEGLEVWRTDTNQGERWNGSSWEYVAGRQHMCEVRFSRTDVPAGLSGPVVLTADRFNWQVGDAWTINTDRNVRIPQTGLWNLSADVGISGTAGSIGRVYVQFDSTNGVVGERIPAYNENNFSATVSRRIDLGTWVRLRVWHEAGATRDYTATVTMALAAGL